MKKLGLVLIVQCPAPRDCLGSPVLAAAGRKSSEGVLCAEIENVSSAALSCMDELTERVWKVSANSSGRL